MILTGEQKIQDKLQGLLKKIKSEELRNRVTAWQKYLASASARFRFDSFSSVDECSSGPSTETKNGNENESDGSLNPYDVCTPSDSGTCILVDGKSLEMEEPLTVGLVLCSFIMLLRNTG